MYTTDKIKELISYAVCEHLDLSPRIFESASNLHLELGNFGADSLDLLELLMNVEDIFNIEITDEEAESFITFQNVIDFIQAKVN